MVGAVTAQCFCVCWSLSWRGHLPLLSACSAIIQDAAQALHFQGAMRFPGVVSEILKSWCRLDTYLSDWPCPQMPHLAVRAHTCWVSALLFQCTYHRASQFRQCFKNDVRLCPLDFKVLRSGFLVFLCPVPHPVYLSFPSIILRAHKRMELELEPLPLTPTNANSFPLRHVSHICCAI